jgi:hypothetical protein
MNTTISVRGTVLPDGSLELAAPLPLPQGEVEVTIRPVTATPAPEESLADFLDRITAQQKARGHVSPTAERIDSEIRQMRDEWD